VFIAEALQTGRCGIIESIYAAPKQILKIQYQQKSKGLFVMQNKELFAKKDTPLGGTRDFLESPGGSKSETLV
jgi:hypothetical protein